MNRRSFFGRLISAVTLPAVAKLQDMPAPPYDWSGCVTNFELQGAPGAAGSLGTLGRPVPAELELTITVSGPDVALCPFVFRDARCGCTSMHGDCGKTFRDCFLRGNTPRFGGQLVRCH